MGWGKPAHTAYNHQKQESQAGGGKLTVVCRGRKPLNRKRPCAKRSAFRMAELFLFYSNISISRRQRRAPDKRKEKDSDYETTEIMAVDRGNSDDRRAMHSRLRPGGPGDRPAPAASS